VRRLTETVHFTTSPKQPVFAHHVRSASLSVSSATASNRMADVAVKLPLPVAARPKTDAVRHARAASRTVACVSGSPGEL
jgi:hypothetical protein